MMTNGKSDRAEIEAILGGGQADVNRYLVTSAIETMTALDEMPQVVAGAVAEAVAACQASHASERRRLALLWQARQRAAGVRSFWATMGKVLAALCAGGGLIAILVTLFH